MGNLLFQLGIMSRLLRLLEWSLTTNRAELCLYLYMSTRNDEWKSYEGNLMLIIMNKEKYVQVADICIDPTRKGVMY